MHGLIQQSTGDMSFAADRLIAVDVRPRSFGFIVMEGMSVLDCGSRTCRRKHADDCLGQRFRLILEIYSPSTIALRSQHEIRTADKEKGAVVRGAIRAECKKYGARIVEITASTVRQYFSQHHAYTKYQIADAVATFLPELAWKLPPRRKAWQSEHYRMSIFDAAAVALTHIGPRADSPPSVAVS